jgi:predicted GTPase
MTPSFSTTTSAQQDRKPIWRHSRTADQSPLFAPRTTFTKPASQTSEPIAMMVLGKTGDGKSSLLNDILGHEVFKQKASVKVSKNTADMHDSGYSYWFLFLSLVTNSRCGRKGRVLGSVASVSTWQAGVWM